jgi:hypothetical protein
MLELEVCMNRAWELWKDRTRKEGWIESQIESFEICWKENFEIGWKEGIERGEKIGEKRGEKRGEKKGEEKGLEKGRFEMLDLAEQGYTTQQIRDMLASSHAAQA